MIETQGLVMAGIPWEVVGQVEQWEKRDRPQPGACRAITTQHKDRYLLVRDHSGWYCVGIERKNHGPKPPEIADIITLAANKAEAVFQARSQEALREAAKKHALGIIKDRVLNDAKNTKGGIIKPPSISEKKKKKRESTCDAPPVLLVQVLSFDRYPSLFHMTALVDAEEFSRVTGFSENKYIVTYFGKPRPVQMINEHGNNLGEFGINVADYVDSQTVRIEAEQMR